MSNAEVLGGGATVHGNIEELRRWGGKLSEIQDGTGMLAVRSAALGNTLSQLGLSTGTFPAMIAQTGQLTTGLGQLKAQTELLQHGIEASAAAYEEIEAAVMEQFSSILSLGALTRVVYDMGKDGIPKTNDVIYLINNGLPFGSWLAAAMFPGGPILKAGWQFTKKGLEMVIGQSISRMDALWFAAHGVVGAAGLFRLGKYTVTETTKFGSPVTDGWQRRGTSGGSLEEMMEHAEQSFPEQAGESALMVSKYTDENGHETVRVTIPGTQFEGTGDWREDYGHETNAWGLSGMREAMVLDSQHVIEAVMGALDDAGIDPGADVMIDGYSQGGTHAMNLATDERFTEKYDVKGVVTYGGVDSHIDTPEDLPVLNIYHEADRARITDGAMPNYSVNRMALVLKDEHPDHPLSSGVFGGGHNFQAMKELTLAAMEDEELAEELSHVTEQFEAMTAGTVQTKTYTLERQDPGLPRSPLVIPGLETAKSPVQNR